jgi:bla regulator protein BlaR1
MDAAANHIWQSTIVALAAAALTVAFRRNSATVRYWIWFAAAMKFLVPFAALAAVANILPLPQAPRVATGAFDAATVIFRSSAVPTLRGTTSTVLAGVWLLGVLVVLARWVWQWQRLAADARQSPPIVDGVVHDTLRRIERTQGISAPTRVVASSRSVEPGVLGIRNPVLIWPRHLTAGLADAHVNAILAHEMCHIARRDNLLASVQMLVTALFWFHPLVWWIGTRLVDERERACDERVLALGGAPATYAKGILETCRLCLASPIVNVSGVTGGNLKTRIVRIMKNVPAAPLGPGRKIALVLAALLMTFASIAGREAAPARQDADREVHKPGGRVVAPKLLKEVKPHYTLRAMEEKVQGEVLLECVVKADGTVGDIKIVKPLDADLDKEAMKAAAQWLFEPGTRDGKPVNVLVTIAIAFTLK